MTMFYNNPPTTGSTVDGEGSSQVNTFMWDRKSLIEAKKDMYFSPLADVTNMPKHYGKKIKVYHYIPLLDDRNTNGMGLDAAGVTIKAGFQVRFQAVTASIDFVVEADADAAIADLGSGAKSGAGPWTLTFAAPVTAVVLTTEALALSVQAAAGAEGSVISRSGGNLYGSSKDIGTIEGKLPSLTENGGRVNRVGFTRLQREGIMSEFGFFTEFTQESLDFDSDDELYAHISREMVTGAVQLSEAVLQKELLAGAGVVVYTGAASADNEITGEGADISEVDYKDLMALNRILNDNRTPKQTKVITGSRMVDTKTINSGRILYIGSELETTVKSMTDLFNNPAFISVEKYAAGGTVLNGEIGTIDQFRIVVVPEMLHWAGAGAAVVTNPGYEESAGRYNVYPMLCIGGESFTTIGFQQGGKAMKFNIIAKKPGKQMADLNDPYGKKGFSSISWWHGTMIIRPERIGVVKTVARI